MDTAQTEQTETDRRQTPLSLEEGKRWTLRVLYSGTAGIVQAEPVFWDGQKPLMLGRRTAVFREGPSLPVEDPRVSREHAQLVCSGASVFVKDCDSKNGTWINGRRLRPGESWELSTGALLAVGDSLVLLRYEPALVADREISSIVGASETMSRLRVAVARAATARHPVLLLGETGTGKGVAAQALHQLSGRRGKLVSVNCAAIPETLAESLFFGVQRGAFTEAVEHPGFFGEAHQGTLFLDEVGDLPLALQPKLLHALETNQVIPLGSSRSVTWDVRIVAATNQNLEKALAQRSFRPDLYARLADKVLSMPPLRERREDILRLARHLAEGSFEPSPRLAAALVRYDWPRNVRELAQIVRHVSMQDSESVATWLEAQSAEQPASSSPDPRRGRWKAGDPPPTKRQLVALLEEFRGNLRRIELDVGFSRRQFHRWAEQHGIDIDTYRNPGAAGRHVGRDR